MQCSFYGDKNFGKERFLVAEHLTSSNTKTAYVINFKLSIHISHSLLHKSISPFLPRISSSCFIALLQSIYKSYFEQNQWKLDYSKNIWKEEKCVHAFIWVLVRFISVRKIIENHN